MKKIGSLICLLLAGILLFTALPVAADEPNDCLGHVCDYRRDCGWSYDDSLIVTRQRETEKAFTPADFPTLTVAQVDLTAQTTTDQGFAYEMVLVFWLPEEEVAAKQTIQNAIATLEKMPDVVSVERNRYAPDYGEKASYIRLNQQEVYLPAYSGQTELWVEDKHLVISQGYDAIGVEFTVDPETFGDVTEGSFVPYGISTFWAVPEDAVINQKGKPGYDNYDPNYQWFDHSLKNVSSPTGRYFASISEEARGGWVSEYCHPLSHLLTAPEILSAQLLYGAPAPTGIPPHEKWVSLNEDVVRIAAINGQSPDQHDQCLEFNHRVTVTAIRPGTAEIQVTTGEGNVSRSTTLTIHVYLPGDVNDDQQINAADALGILRYAVGKAQWEPDDQTYRMADATGDRLINSQDALWVLRYTVGKLATVG